LPPQTPPTLAFDFFALPGQKKQILVRTNLGI